MVTKSNATDFHLRAKAILAVRHGRELAELLLTTRGLPIGEVRSAILSACIRRLQCGEVTDGRDLTVIEAMLENVAAVLPNEVVDVRVDWCLATGEDGEEFWCAENVPVYSQRGEILFELQIRMKRFLEVRQRFIDQVNAERLERQHLR
ncbi:hypothetical protein MAA5396_04452 [Marinovum algicola]|uniref:Uncharacterized protein n=1 Tax=Marinovum algicola TaxID=42444 RepID=A0A975ZQG1_9RHOB|nr:hypothetical protein [Marinovum algicola]SEK05312.1 hypothetical protein SAMN04487940_12177 [Marinovum algicola]SLN75328.1 hypothetical protein MAA5396_04452 [Marinovum algicola]